jgi:transposase-like protein
METFKIDTSDFEEDTEQPWLIKQKEEAEELAASSQATRRYRLQKGDLVGKFIFVEKHYYFKKAKAYYQCPLCSNTFLNSTGSIRTRKKCKVCKQIV